VSKIVNYAPGSFCWADLATKDLAAAKKFYGEMFGWTSVDIPTPGGPYVIFKSGDDDVAGLMPPPPGVPNYWGVHFSVASADEAAAKIAATGGKILNGPFDAMDAGRLAVAQDPQGACFCVWQAMKHPGATYQGAFGRIVWPELVTRDTVGAAAFYHGLFGWGTKPESGLDAVPYVEWQHGGQSTGGMLAMTDEKWKGIPPYWGLYITVADCDERTAKAVELGSKVYVPPTDIPNVGRFSAIGDPQGAMFQIIKMSAVH
jgi:predicted enzyme related to lactoylglutathione lyase